MRAVQKIAQRFAEVSTQVHRGRFVLVWDLVTAMLRGSRATVTSLGRNLDRAIFERHAIKCADRALSNAHLFDERHLWYRAIASMAVGACQRPVIVVDGTELDAGWGALRASLTMDGRPVTILDEVYRLTSLNKSRVHARFLRALRDVLPPSCRPVLLVDGAFMRPFFEKLRQLGWDYVGRLGSAMWVHSQDLPSLQVRDLFRFARRKPRDLGACTLFARSRFHARVVLYDGRSERARRPASPFPRGQNRQRKRRQKAREPWVLVTSSHDLAARDIVALYQRRMQIEESFRDDKSPRFGRGFRLARCSSTPRLAVLLLLLALASFVLLTLGRVAQARRLAPRFQANSTARRTLSLASLGLRLISREDFRPHDHDIDRAFSYFARAGASPPA